MKYNKIVELQKQKKVSNRKIAESIGMSDVGFGKMLTNESCDVRTLEAIAKFFKVPVSYFFEDFSNDINQDCDCEEKQRKIEELTAERDSYMRKYIECLEDLALKKKAAS